MNVLDMAVRAAKLQHTTTYQVGKQQQTPAQTFRPAKCGDGVTDQDFTIYPRTGCAS